MSVAVDAIWKDDLLGRQDDALFLIEFLSARIAERGHRNTKRSFVLNIDAGWGHGKTYFLSRMQETLIAAGHIVAHVNAWNDDHADDPLIAVMAAIDAGVRSNSKVAPSSKRSLGKLAEIGGQVVAAGAKGLLKQAASKYLGDDTVEQLSELIGVSASGVIDSAEAAEKEIGKKLDELYDAEGKALVEKFTRGKKSISDFKIQLSKVLENFKSKSQLPLFVLVDELDRCRPPYAVALLERVKHLFDVDDVVFVLATDTAQLRHSINALYGSGFDAGRYLHRFFDQTYRFETPSVGAFVAARLSNIDQTKLLGSPLIKNDQFISQAFAAFNLSLRDIEQCIEILENCVTVWSAPCPMVLIGFIPLIVAQQQRMLPTYSASFKQDLTNALNGTDLDRWKVDLNVFANGERQILVGWRVFELLVKGAQSVTLPELAGRDRSGLESQWINRVFQEEMALRFRGGYMSNNPPHSLLREYPKIVRSVGRLKPT